MDSTSLSVTNTKKKRRVRHKWSVLSQLPLHPCSTSFSKFFSLSVVSGWKSSAAASPHSKRAAISLGSNKNVGKVLLSCLRFSVERRNFARESLWSDLQAATLRTESEEERKEGGDQERECKATLSRRSEEDGMREKGDRQIGRDRQRDEAQQRETETKRMKTKNQRLL